jgi:hypothetical protein
MITIPDELLASARIDGASEWRVYWQIVLPLAAPAMAVLAIFSVMWRWNDFLWPLIVLTRSELFTLQVGLAAFQGRTQCTMALYPGDDRPHFAAHHPGLCLPATFYYDGYRHDRHEISSIQSLAQPTR